MLKLVEYGEGKKNASPIDKGVKQTNAGQFDIAKLTVGNICKNMGAILRAWIENSKSETK